MAPKRLFWPISRILRCCWPRCERAVERGDESAAPGAETDALGVQAIERASFDEHSTAPRVRFLLSVREKRSASELEWAALAPRLQQLVDGLACRRS